MLRKFIFSISSATLIISNLIFPIAKGTTKNAIKQNEINLFNGHSLEGWSHIGKGKFIVKDGLLQSEGGMGLLWYTKKKFGNTRLRVVYKTTESTTNSGIFVRIAHPPKDPWDAVHHGYEIQICDEGSDAFDQYHVTGSIYSFSKALKQASKPVGEWNTYDIDLMDKKILVYLNGIKVNEYHSDQSVPPRGNDSDPKRGERLTVGYIGVQNHDHNAKSKSSHVYYKEISIRPLLQGNQI